MSNPYYLIQDHVIRFGWYVAFQRSENFKASEKEKARWKTTPSLEQTMSGQSYLIAGPLQLRNGDEVFAQATILHHFERYSPDEVNAEAANFCDWLNR